MRAALDAHSAGTVTILCAAHPAAPGGGAGEHGGFTTLTPRGWDSHGLEPTPGSWPRFGRPTSSSTCREACSSAWREALARQLVDAGDLADLPQDAHFWLDPLRMAELSERAADGLAEADPDHAAEYARAADRLGVFDEVTVQRALARVGDHDAEHLRTPAARRGGPHPCRHGRSDVRSTRRFCGPADRTTLTSPWPAGSGAVRR